MKSKLSLFKCTRDLGLLVVMALLLGNLAFVYAQPNVPLASAAVPEPVTPGASADLPPGISTDWWTAAQENIRRSEYHVTWQEQTYLADVPAAYQSPNRAQNLRTYFADAGPIIIPRVLAEEATALPWRWELNLVTWGREQARQPAPQAEIRVQDNLVEYRRGELVEWYRNDEKGLEQGFTLASPPPALSHLTREEGQSLVFELAYSSDLTPELVQDGAEIEFRTHDGSTVLRYGSLLAKDAAGQTLPGRLVLTSQVIQIIVDDAAALYPIQVDATITGLPDAWNWKVEGNAADTEFGCAVSTAGDVNGDGYSDVIVGARKYDGGQTDEGRAYVYHGSPSGLSTTAAWHKEGDQTGAQFGAAVSTAGDVNGDGYADVVVGAPYWESTGSQADEGGIWVYHGAYLVGLSTTPGGHAELNQAGAYLGISVGTAGNVNGDAYSDVIAGASHATNGQSAEGIVRVWHGSATGIGTNTTANWQAESNQANAHFGNSVFTAGDVNGDGYSDVIIGAPEYDNGQADEGAAFVWHGSANGVNNDVNGNPTNAAWTTESNQASALLGVDVSMAGDVDGDGYADVIVGAPYYTNGQANEGGTWVYHGSSTGLNTSATTHDEGNQAGARFGTSVGTAGDVNGDGYADVIIGAPDYTNGESAEGRVWVWHGSSSGMSATYNWRTEGNQTDAHLGMSAATAGDVNGDGYSDVIIGAPGYHNPSTDEGAAFVYHGSPATLSDTADWTKRSNRADTYFGWSVGTAGDVNGDGYADIIVGAPLWDDGQTNEGGAWVYHGSDSGVISAPAWYKASDQADAQYGYSVGAAGDVNGDGYGDVIVGAILWNASQTDEGGAWVYHGSSSGVTSAPDWYKTSGQAYAQYGYSVGTAGDVNGDGYADIIVGTPFWDHGQTNEGGAWVYHGSDSGVISAPAWYKQSDQAYAQFGYSVGTAGDVNGDGYSDVIVGAPYWEDDVNNEGRAWVYHGSAQGLRKTESWHAESNQLGASLGWSVGTAGDVNGDGYSDVIVGAPYWGDGGLTSEGKVWVFHGSWSGLSASSAWSRESGQNDAYYGYAVGTAGDVNGDGYADIILGAPHMTGSVSDEGTTRVYCGSATGLHSSYAWKGEGGQTLSWYGMAVGTAGDVNGDGYAEVIVGAKDYNETYVNEGKVFLYYGNASAGVSLKPRQARFGSSRSIAPLGRSDDMAGFRLYLTMRTPFGRGLVQPETEIKPLGVPFNGANTTWWGFWQSVVPGAERYTAFSNLVAGTAYHWRVRVCYSPVTNPFMPTSRWITMPWNGWNETDLRTAGTRVFLPLVLRDY
jgi:hypothetical protein